LAQSPLLTVPSETRLKRETSHLVFEVVLPILGIQKDAPNHDLASFIDDSPQNDATEPRQEALSAQLIEPLPDDLLPSNPSLTLSDPFNAHSANLPRSNALPQMVGMLIQGKRRAALLQL